MDSTSWSKNHRVGQPAVDWGHPGVGPWNVAKNPHSESQNLWFIWFSGAVLSQVGHLQIGGVCVLLTSATALAGFSGEAAFDAGTVRFKTAAAEIWKDEETCFSRWRHSIFSWPSQVVAWTWYSRAVTMHFAIVTSYHDFLLQLGSESGPNTCDGPRARYEAKVRRYFQWTATVR